MLLTKGVAVAYEQPPFVHHIGHRQLAGNAGSRDLREGGLTGEIGARDGPGSDLVGLQDCLHCSSVDVLGQQDGKGKGSGDDPGRFREDSDREIGQQVTPAPMVLLAACDEAIQTLQLDPTNRTGEFGRAQVVAGADKEEAVINVRIGRSNLRPIAALTHPAMGPQAAHGVGQISVVGHHDATLEGGQMVAEEKGEARCTSQLTRAHPSALSTRRSACVLQHLQAQRLQRLTVGGHAQQMNRKGCAGSGPHGLGRTTWTKTQAVLFDVHKHRYEPNLGHGEEARGPAHGGYQDLVTALSPDEVADGLNLYAIRDRPWQIQACSAKSGEGLQDGMEWLVKQVRPSRR